MARYPNGVNFKFKKPGKPHQDKMVFELLRALSGHKTSDICRKTWISHSTISKWRTRRTRYPTHICIAAALEVVGKKLVIVDDDQYKVEKKPKKSSSKMERIYAL